MSGQYYDSNLSIISIRSICDILPCHVSMDNWYFMSFPFNYFGIMKIGPEMELGRII